MTDNGNDGGKSTEAPHLLVVEARFYEDIADQLVKGATAAIEGAGATYDRVAVPGAFELPAAIQFAIRSYAVRGGQRRYDGYVALGCVIRGETAHFDYVCGESARGLQDLVLQYSLALGFGLLTVDTREQARERAAVDKGNKGGSAARAALDMIGLKERFGLLPR